MRDYLTLGSTPYDEPCAQVGSDNYRKLSIVECQVFQDQLLRTLPIPKELEESNDIAVRMKGFPHDYGTYYEVCVFYNDENEQAVAYAFELESLDCPDWDDTSLQRLAENNYTLHLDRDL